MSVQVKCVHCGALVNEFAAECPKCGKPVANRDAPTKVTESPWKMKKTDHGKKSPVIPVVIIALVVIAAVLFFLVLK